IRGGGATVDLSCFDGYELASALAQFPLPLLSGIGHERDRSVADMVAHTSVKTPTAAAELILSCLEQEDRKIEDMAASLLDMGQEAISAGVRQLQFYKERIVQLSSVQKNRGQLQIQKIESELRWAAREHLQQRKHRLDAAVQTIGLLSPQILARQLQRLDVLKLKLEAYSPELQLKRGFSITLHQGRILRSAGGLPPGSLLETRLEDGRVFSKTIQKQT
ncbi:MAG TPA: exodeoxyribonuclease VII large subunit, partial [Bacteroidales bacterium]|nr:exodeoxyribonuclease VII large subunit [Bacteroidales bacterium]